MLSIGELYDIYLIKLLKKKKDEYIDFYPTKHTNNQRSEIKLQKRNVVSKLEINCISKYIKK